MLIVVAMARQWWLTPLIKPSTREAEAARSKEGLCEFEASLVYIESLRPVFYTESSRTVKATLRDPILKKIIRKKELLLAF